MAFIRFLLTIIVAVALTQASPVHAQIEEIVVTATKRAESCRTSASPCQHS